MLIRDFARQKFKAVCLEDADARIGSELTTDQGSNDHSEISSAVNKTNSPVAQGYHVTIEHYYQRISYHYHILAASSYSSKSVTNTESSLLWMINN